MQIKENQLKELSERIRPYHCPVCGGHNLVVNGYLYQELSMTPNDDGKLDFSGITDYCYRNVAKVTCHDCGYVMTFLRPKP